MIFSAVWRLRGPRRRPAVEITKTAILLCIIIGGGFIISTASGQRLQPYEVLGVHRRATNQEIRRAYKTKVKQWHPDKNNNGDSEDEKVAVAKFVEINAAYELLSDPDRRRGYDNHGITEDSPNFRQVLTPGNCSL